MTAARLRSLTAKLLVAAAVIALLAVAGEHVHAVLPWVDRQLDALGPWAPWTFVALVALTVPLLVPDTLYGVTAGVVFGLTLGTTTYFVGTYVGCVLAFALARGLLERRVRAWVEGQATLSAVARAARRRGLGLTALLRLTPVSAAGASYALGAADVSWRNFLLGTCALLPAHFVTVYTGVVARHVTTLHHEGVAWGRGDMALLAGLVACGLVVWYVCRLVQRAVHEQREAEISGSDAAAP